MLFKHEMGEMGFEMGALLRDGLGLIVLVAIIAAVNFWGGLLAA